MPEISEIRIWRAANGGRVTRVLAHVTDRGRFVTTVDLPVTQISFKQKGNDLGSIKLAFHGSRVKFAEGDG